MNPPKTSSILLRKSSITAADGGQISFPDGRHLRGLEDSHRIPSGRSDGIHGLAVDGSGHGNLGVMVGGLAYQKIGGNILVALGIMYFVSALWSGCSTAYGITWSGRFIGGMGIGNLNRSHPLHISVIAPAERGEGLSPGFTSSTSSQASSSPSFPTTGFGEFYGGAPHGAGCWESKRSPLSSLSSQPPSPFRKVAAGSSPGKMPGVMDILRLLLDPKLIP